jgi:hypothetical protein
MMKRRITVRAYYTTKVTLIAQWKVNRDFWLSLATSDPLPMSRTRRGKFQLLMFDLAVAVEKNELFLPFFEHWQLQTQKGLFLLPFSSTFWLKLQSLELVLSNPTVIELWKSDKSDSVAKGFLLFLLSVQKNHLFTRQYRKYYLVSVLSFSVTLTVEISKYIIRTVDQYLGRQHKRENSCFLLPGQQSINPKGKYAGPHMQLVF